MVPYSFNIKPATAVAEVLIKYGAKVNSELEPSPTIKILIPRGMKKIYIYIFLKIVGHTMEVHLPVNEL